MNILIVTGDDSQRDRYGQELRVRAAGQKSDQGSGGQHGRAPQGNTDNGWRYWSEKKYRKFSHKLQVSQGNPCYHSNRKSIRLFERLSRFAEDMSNVEVCGYIEDIERYYERADLIVTKLGGITMFEAIYTGTPMLLTSPALIQEKANARYIFEKHIGRVISDENSVSTAALQMLGDDHEKAYIKASMKRIK